MAAVRAPKLVPKVFCSCTVDNLSASSTHSSGMSTRHRLKVSHALWHTWPQLCCGQRQCLLNNQWLTELPHEQHEHGTVLLGPCSKICSNRRAQPRLWNAKTLQDRASAAEGNAVTPHRPDGRNRSSVTLSCHLSGVTQSTGRRGKSQLERTRSSSIDLRPRGCSIIRGSKRIHRALKATAADHMPRLAGPPHRFHASRRITLRAGRSRVAVKLQGTQSWQ